jgi:hypothetical protein
MLHQKTSISSENRTGRILAETADPNFLRSAFRIAVSAMLVSSDALSFAVEAHSRATKP